MNYFTNLFLAVFGQPPVEYLDLEKKHKELNENYDKLKNEFKNKDEELNNLRDKFKESLINYIHNNFSTNEREEVSANPPGIKLPAWVNNNRLSDEELKRDDEEDDHDFETDEEWREKLIKDPNIKVSLGSQSTDKE